MKPRLPYLKAKQPGLKTKNFDSQKEYDVWKEKNKHKIEGDIRLGILRDRDYNIISITAGYYLK